MSFHKKYTKISPWWIFIRQEFVLEQSHSRKTLILNISFDDHKVMLQRNGILTVKPGFDFGASGPTIDTPSSREASCIHDAIYYLSDKGIFKGQNSQKMRGIADRLLYNICLENGMWKWRAKAWLKSLIIFGGFSWESEL